MYIKLDDLNISAKRQEAIPEKLHRLSKALSTGLPDDTSLEDLNRSEADKGEVEEHVLRLHRAAAFGTPDDIKAMIGSGTDVDAREGAEMTPLMTAAYHERPDSVAVLLEAGADIGARDINYCNVLHLSCKNSGLECIKALLAAGADMEAENGFGHRPLHMASLYGTKELLEHYIDRSDSLEHKDQLFRTPLLLVAVCGKLHNLKTLIDNGADIGAEDDCACNLLHMAAENKNAEVLCHVLKMGFQTDTRDRYGKTALFYAAVGNNPENVKSLLDAGADIMKTDNDGQTALHFAALTAKEEVIGLLAHSKSFVNHRDSNGNTALHIAAKEDNPRAARALLNAGADINSRDDEGCTPILVAAGFNRFEVVKVLFEAGADTSITGNDGSDLISRAREAINSPALGVRGDQSWNYLKEMGLQDQQKPKVGRIVTVHIPAELILPGNKSYGETVEVEFPEFDADAFAEWADGLAGKCTPAKFGDMKEWMGFQTMSIEIPRLLAMAEVMSEMGFGFAPDLALISDEPSHNDPVLLYRTESNHMQLIGKNEFRVAIVSVCVGAYMFSLGNVSFREAGPALRKTAESWGKLDEDGMAGIQTNIEYLRDYWPGNSFFERMLENSPAQTKLMLRNLAVSFARSLNAGKAKKLAAMESFYESLKVDPKLAHSDLQSGVRDFQFQ